MTVTTSAQLNPDQLLAALQALSPGAGFTSAGGELTSTNSKTLTAYGATDTQLTQAVTTASGQYADYTGNTAAIQTAISTHLNQIEGWLAANPNGAILTAQQTAFLARMLVGLGRIVLNQVSTIGQAI